MELLFSYMYVEKSHVVVIVIYLQKLMYCQTYMGVGAKMWHTPNLTHTMVIQNRAQYLWRLLFTSHKIIWTSLFWKGECYLFVFGSSFLLRWIVGSLNQQILVDNCF